MKTLGFIFGFCLTILIFLFIIMDPRKPNPADLVQEAAIFIESGGSGTLVRWHGHVVIVTAAHCVHKKTPMCFNNKEIVLCYAGWVGDSENPELPDVAVLVPTSPIKARPIEIKDYNCTVVRNLSLIAAGAPDCQAGMFTRGYVNVPRYEWHGREYIVVNGDFSPGSSGSGCYTNQLEFIGIIVRQNGSSLHAGFLSENATAVRYALHAWEDQ